ncbi:MAG: hypothetical protein U5N86_10075 [Planctomycetota bacterium]|nr:hypothetical protein [Planctomycetota bacterium]
MRTSFFLAFFSLVLLCAACSLSGTGRTWEASTSYSPYSPSLSPFAKARNLLSENLDGDILLFARSEDGVAIACDEYNNWAAVDIDGQLIKPPPSPEAIPDSIAVMSDGFLLLGSSDWKLSLDDTGWLLELLNR